MEPRKFSLMSFIGGMVVGLLIAFAFVAAIAFSFYQSVVSGTTEEQGGFVWDIAETVREGVFERETTSLYAKFKGFQDDHIVVEAERMSGVETFKFSYDEGTAFIRLEHDDASTEVPIQPEEINFDEYITVTLDAPLQNGDGRRAVKVVKF